MTPEDRRYMKSHEWVKIEGDTAIVGITDYAQAELGDITFVELPEEEQELEQGHECAVVESIKAASDIYAPLSGKVKESNIQLQAQPELINEDPYEVGWIFKIKDFDPEEIEDLLLPAEYDHLLEDDED